ncbi:hypothetical protein A8B98_07090 [Hymenobacter sp. UV11]|nr:hypothetical protein A8B98_07090 [Hymenobacter sp. UV11]
MALSLRLEAFLITLDTAPYCLGCRGAAGECRSHAFCGMVRPKATPLRLETIQLIRQDSRQYQAQYDNQNQAYQHGWFAVGF